MQKKFFLVLFLLFFLPQISFAQNTLKTAWLNNVGPLNPHAYFPNEMFAQNMVYEGLTAFDGEKIVPLLAKSWEISEDEKTYTFFLRDDVKFSDGTPFNAHIAGKNFQAIMNNKERHSWLALVNLIESWKALDDYTFELKLSSPYNLTLTELSLPRPFRFLGENGFIDGKPDTKTAINNPVGTGPWQLTDQKLGLYDCFERNPHYRNGKTGDFDSVKIYVLPEANSRILALETGQIDLLIGEGNFNIENFVRVKQNPNFAGEKSNPRISCLIALNSNRSFTKDKAVRTAVLQAVNKDVILDYILKDQAYKADYIFSPDTQFYGEGKTYSFNPEQAKKLLLENGYALNGIFFEKDGKTLELDLHYLGIDPIQKAIAEAVQADLAKIGIKLNLRAEEYTLLTSLQQNGEFDLIFNRTWGPPYEPTSYLASMRRPSHADYQAQRGLENKAEIDGKISRLLTTTDSAEFETLHREVLRDLHESAVYLPVMYEPDFVLYNKTRIDNFRFGNMSTEFLFHELKVKK